MKVVGQRKRGLKGIEALEAANGFLKLAQKFRKDDAFVPPGVYKFKTFEEIEAWRYRMIRGKKPAPPQ